MTQHYQGKRRIQNAGPTEGELRAYIVADFPNGQHGYMPLDQSDADLSDQIADCLEHGAVSFHRENADLSKALKGGN